MRAELDELELDDELLLELELLLDDGLGDGVGVGLLEGVGDGEGELEPLGLAGLSSSPQPCWRKPRPASATPPESTRRNCRRSSRRSSASGFEGPLNIIQTSTWDVEQ